MKKNIIEKHYKNIFMILAVVLIIAISTYFLFKIPFFRQLELKSVDYRFRYRENKFKKDKDIVIIAIDDRSLKYFNKNGISWPWPRDFFSILVDYIKKDGAKDILFDILFYEPDIDREETDSEYTDGKFAQSIQNAKNVILAAKLQNEKNVFSLDDKFKIRIEGFKPKKNYEGIILPLNKFLIGAKRIGIINVSPDKDGVIRHIPFFYKLNDFFVPQMGITPFLSKTAKIQKNKVILFQKEIPVDRYGKYFVNWYNPKRFKYVTFSSVIKSAFSSERLLPKGFFKDKIVLIGSTATGIDDYITAPFAKPVPGVELWATIVSNIKNNEFVKEIGSFYELLILFFIAFITIFFFLRFHIKLLYFFLFILPVVYVVATYKIFEKIGIVLPLVSVIVSFLISFLYSALISYFSEGKSKKELKKVFSRYLHPMVVEQIVNNPDEIKLGGDTIFATVFFSDIANFTTYSEGKKAEEVISVLNMYFKAFSGFILDNKGLLDKYMGDGIMAIFGAPFYIKEHAFLACKTALEHMLYSKTVNNEAKFLHQNTRIGINSGFIVAGNLGSEKKTEYTAIGDDVNLGSRLEGVNKIFKTKIIISGATYQLVKDYFVCRELDKLKVKGKKQATSIYELIDFVKNKEKYIWIDIYQKGLYEYRNANWDKAITYFNRVLKTKSDDYPSKLMIERCNKLKIENPKDWDGVISLKTK